ncbi:AAA family ATPase [Dickeya oryzae]
MDFFFGPKAFFNLASEIEHLDAEPAGSPPVINSYGGHSLHEQSHGESFLSLMMNRFGGKGLYLLDEPEAALSPARQLAMLARMHDLIQDDSQFIIATHSPILLGYPDALIYQFDGDSLSLVNYKDTDHYQITRSFLNNPEKMLQELMKK